MENYINNYENKKLYYNYVLNELSKYNTSGTILVSEKISKIDINNLDDLSIREICRLTQFLNISENIIIDGYHDWFKYIREVN